MTRIARRAVAVLALSAVLLPLTAAPALAHFCLKTDWGGVSSSKAAKSSAWLTGDDWKGFIAGAVEAGEACQLGADHLVAFIDSQPEGTLYMGPGLLAGGTLHNGKDNRPAQFGELPFDEAFALCGAPEQH